MAPNSIQARATQLTSTVLQRADITLFVLDARCCGFACHKSLTSLTSAQASVPLGCSSGGLKKCLYRVGLIPGDHDLAQWLREKTTAPIVLAANKAERRNAEGSGSHSRLRLAILPCNRDILPTLVMTK